MNKIKALRKENDELEKQVLKENDEYYTNMIVYIRGANLNMAHQEYVRNDLVKMVLDAQERGENIVKVFGPKPKEVCDEIIEAIPKMGPMEHFLENYSFLLFILSNFGIIYFVRDALLYTLGKKVVPGVSLTASDILTAFVITGISIFIVNNIIKSAFDDTENSKEQPWKVGVISAALVIGLVALGRLFPQVWLEMSFVSMAMTIVIMLAIALAVKIYREKTYYTKNF